MIKVVNNKVMFEDWAYAFLKKVVQVFLPAFSTFYFALAKAWDLPDATAVIGSIASLCVFLGVLLHLSSTQYDASGAAHIGTVSLTPNAGGTVMSLHLDPSDVIGKDSVSLKVVPPAPGQKLPDEVVQPSQTTPQTPLPPSQS